MSTPERKVVSYETPKQQGAVGREDLAYMAPMLVFLAFVWVGSKWKDFYPHAYVARAVIVAILLAVLWRSYTKIRWTGWWLGLTLGVLSTFQWIGMQLWLQKHFEFFRPSEKAFDPTEFFAGSSAWVMWGWIVIRIASASLVVPVMEELFWRDFLWRTIIAPADFKLAEVGEKNWPAFLIVAGAFATVHGNWWLTAIIWGMMVGGLLLYTRSLGACIVMHGVTNLLLGIYVLLTRDWSFW